MPRAAGALRVSLVAGPAGRCIDPVRRPMLSAAAGVHHSAPFRPCLPAGCRRYTLCLGPVRSGSRQRPVLDTLVPQPEERPGGRPASRSPRWARRRDRRAPGLPGWARTHGGALLVTGEPGIGKTEFLHAAADAASEVGTRILRGAGHPLRDRDGLRRPEPGLAPSPRHNAAASCRSSRRAQRSPRLRRGRAAQPTRRVERGAGTGSTPIWPEHWRALSRGPAPW